MDRLQDWYDQDEYDELTDFIESFKLSRPRNAIRNWRESYERETGRTPNMSNLRRDIGSLAWGGKNIGHKTIALIKTALEARHQRSVVFHKQRGRELEEIILVLMEWLEKETGSPPSLPFGAQIKGDNYITDISSGSFAFRIMSEYESRKRGK